MALDVLVDPELLNVLAARGIIQPELRVYGFYRMMQELNTANVTAQFKRTFGIRHFHVRVNGSFADGRQFSEVRINADSRQHQPALRVLHQFLYDTKLNELLIEPFVELDDATVADIGGFTPLMSRTKFWQKGVCAAMGYNDIRLTELDGDPIVLTPHIPHDVTPFRVATTLSRLEEEALRYCQSALPDRRHVLYPNAIAIGANGTDPSNTEQPICVSLKGNYA